ncbi:MAG: hypothetical protein RR998_07010 [Oscillospiraceae bacterium]
MSKNKADFVNLLTLFDVFESISMQKTQKWQFSAGIKPNIQAADLMFAASAALRPRISHERQSLHEITKTDRKCFQKH